MASSAKVAMRFGSRSLALHLLRGVGGIGSLGLGLWGYLKIGWPALLLLPLSVWLLKGCPMCWLSGLFETLAYRADKTKKRIVRGRPGVSSDSNDNREDRKHA